MDDYTSLVHTKPEIFEENISWGKKGNKTLLYLNESARPMISNPFFSLKGMWEGQYSCLGRFCLHLQNVFNLCGLLVLNFGPYFCSSVQKTIY